MPTLFALAKTLMTGGGAFMRNAAMVSAACFAVATVSSGGEAEAAARKMVSVSPQGLGPALQSLAKAHGFQIVFVSEDVQGLRTQGAVGELTLNEALTQVLAGTGLTFRYLDNRTVTVMRPESEAFSAGVPGSSSGPAFDIDIPAMNAAKALDLLAEQTGSEMRYSHDLARSREANAVRGRYTLPDGLELLLRDTGLSGGLSGKRVVIIAQNRNVPEGKGDTVKKRGLLAGLIAAVLGSPVTDARADQELESKSNTKLEEIIVTAQKRKERLINVPQSMSVLSADYLDKIHALQFRDFANTVPGLSIVTMGAGNTVVSLRGVTFGIDIGGTVGTYVDEVPYGTSTAFSQGGQHTLDMGLFDLERIEVLRGPQGTLYGASTMGGLLKYVTKEPDPARFGIDVRTGISATRHGGVSYNGSVTVNSPILTDQVALRATGFYSRDGGYIDNVALGKKDVNRADIYGGRADLLVTPTQNLTVRITGFLQDIDRDGEGTANYSFSGVPLDGSLDARRLLPEPYDNRFRLVSGTVAYDLEWATLTSVSSYQTMQSDFDADISSLFVPILEAFLGRSYSAVGVGQFVGTDKFTQEVRFASSGSPIEWLVGGFYTHETSEYAQEFILRDVAGQPAPNDLFDISAPSRYEEYAAFGDLTWHMTSKFNVTGGIRYAHNRQKLEQISSGLFLPPSPPAGHSRDDVLTYLGVARYHFGDHVTGYLRYATGYRPGGPNFVVNDPATGLPIGSPMFEADRLKSYEVGFKAETPDRRFGIDLAGYYIDWSNIKVAVVRGGFGAFDNAAGGASVRGAELSVAARPTPALEVRGTFAYTDAHMDEADLNLGAAKGDQLPNVPRFTGALNADYELPRSGSLQPAIGATVRYVDDRRTALDASDPLNYHLPEYTSVDLRAGFVFGGDNNVNVQLYVHNLLDERGQLSAFNWRGAAPAILQPRTVGISVTTNF